MGPPLPSLGFVLIFGYTRRRVSLRSSAAAAHDLYHYYNNITYITYLLLFYLGLGRPAYGTQHAHVSLFVRIVYIICTRCV